MSKPRLDNWGHQLGCNIPFLEKCCESIVGSYVSPDLFDEDVRYCPDIDLVRAFGRGLQTCMTDDQRRKFRVVILGAEAGEGECCYRIGGLIDRDFSLLISFLVQEVDVAAYLDRELASTSLQAALVTVNEAWKRVHPVDTDANMERPNHPLRDRSELVCKGSPKRLIPSQTRSFVTPIQPAPKPTDLESRIMWLQSLSWNLKYPDEQYSQLLRWRNQTNKSLDDFCNKVKDKKSLLHANQKARTSYSLVAHTCRSRLCLASPQLSPRQALALFSSYVKGAIETCDEIAKQHRKDSGLFNRAWKHSQSKSDLLQLLYQSKTELEGIQVSNSEVTEFTSPIGNGYRSGEKQRAASVDISNQYSIDIRSDHDDIRRCSVPARVPEHTEYIAL